MNVIVTGGAGYIGSHAVQILLDKGHEVVIIDDLSTGWGSLLSPFAKHYQININDISALDEVFKKEKEVSAILHFAALISVPESVEKPIEYSLTNIVGTMNLLSMATKYNVKNFIFSSTAAVYGEGDKGTPVTEESPAVPINPYGDSKLAAEKIVKSWAKANDSNYVIFRYFNVSGMLSGMKALNAKEKRISGNHLIPLINMYVLGLNKNFNIFGDDYETKDGSCIRDYIHVVDLVDAHIMGLEWSRKNNKSDLFNLGTKNGFSVKEVIKETEVSLNKKIMINIGKRRSGDPAILVSDNSKVFRVLGWKPKRSLKEMIESDYLFRK